MSPQANNYELFLFTHNNFLNSKLRENATHHKHDISSGNLLKRACWAGLVFEMLPVFFAGISGSPSVSTWKIIPSANSIVVTLSSGADVVNQLDSEDPSLIGFDKQNFN